MSSSNGCIDISKTYFGNVYSISSGLFTNDTITITGSATHISDLYGVNAYTIGGNVHSFLGSIDADTVNIAGNVTSTINLGNGKNVASIGGDVYAYYGGLGSDIVNIGGDATCVVSLGDGTNSATIGGNLLSLIGGHGRDSVVVDGTLTSAIKLGAGNDSVSVGVMADCTDIWLGHGTDVAFVKEFGHVTEVFGDCLSYDTLQLLGTAEDYHIRVIKSLGGETNYIITDDEGDSMYAYYINDLEFIPDVELAADSFQLLDVGATENQVVRASTNLLTNDSSGSASLSMATLVVGGVEIAIGAGPQTVVTADGRSVEVTALANGNLTVTTTGGNINELQTGQSDSLSIEYTVTADGQPVDQVGTATFEIVGQSFATVLADDLVRIGVYDNSFAGELQDAVLDAVVIEDLDGIDTLRLGAVSTDMDELVFDFDADTGVFFFDAAASYPDLASEVPALARPEFEFVIADYDGSLINPDDGSDAFALVLGLF